MSKKKETKKEKVIEEISEAEKALQEEVSSLKDKLLRAVADLENDRKRFEREKEDALKFSITGFARDLLAVQDNLARALENVDEKELDGSPLLKTIHEGVSMTESELSKAFSKHGIEVINPQGEKFDHNWHQAMFEVTETEEEEGTVVNVMQVGYKLHDRLLRPAMVGVAKPKS